jgi:predicted nucleic acid-binding protein
MSKFILDASVALKWVLNEPDRDRALRLREEFQNGTHEHLAPDIFPIEIGHAFSKLHRRGKVPEDLAHAYLAEVMSTSPELYPSLALMSRAYELSLQSQKSLYDCLYVSLAEQEGCSVVTADHGMILNPRSKLVIHISTLGTGE